MIQALKQHTQCTNKKCYQHSQFLSALIITHLSVSLTITCMWTTIKKTSSIGDINTESAELCTCVLFHSLMLIWGHMKPGLLSVTPQACNCLSGPYFLSVVDGKPVILLWFTEQTWWECRWKNKWILALTKKGVNHAHCDVSSHRDVRMEGGVIQSSHL